MAMRGAPRNRLAHDRSSQPKIRQNTERVTPSPSRYRRVPVARAEDVDWKARSVAPQAEPREATLRSPCTHWVVVMYEIQGPGDEGTVS